MVAGDRARAGHLAGVPCELHRSRLSGVSFGGHGPPRGIRGVSVAQRGNRFGRIDDYFQRTDDETCVLVQIETRLALERVLDIAAVDGVDGVFFGPADLAADFGKLGDVNNAEVWRAILAAGQRLKQADKSVGTLVNGAARARELFDAGFDFVACGSDLGLLARGADNLVAELKA